MTLPQLGRLALVAILCAGCVTTTSTTRYRAPEQDLASAECIARCNRWTSGPDLLACARSCPHVQEVGRCGGREDCVEVSTSDVAVDGEAVGSALEVVLRVVVVVAEAVPSSRSTSRSSSHPTKPPSPHVRAKPNPAQPR